MFEPHTDAVVAHRYRLLQEIGRGGMGSVWQATDMDLDAPCALKFIVNQETKPTELRARFLREAKAVARLQSPHVVSIRGVGEWEGALYIAMELLKGETLFTRLARTKTLSQRETCRLVTQVSSVLTVAHGEGIVHRDLKPENIWLWSQEEFFAKLLDFGVAKHVMDEGSLLKTATGMLVGTPYYMSPEQAAGDRLVDYRSDLWSLAVIAVQCLAGRLPFESSGLGVLLTSIIHGPTPALARLYPGTTPELEQWWSVATAKDPAARFQSAEALSRAFTLALGLQPSEPPSGVADNPPVEALVPARSLAATSSLSPVTAVPLPTQRVAEPQDLWPGSLDSETHEPSASDRVLPPRDDAAVGTNSIAEAVDASSSPPATPPSSPTSIPLAAAGASERRLVSPPESLATAFESSEPSASMPAPIPVPAPRTAVAAAVAIAGAALFVAGASWWLTLPRGDDAAEELPAAGEPSRSRDVGSVSAALESTNAAATAVAQTSSSVSAAAQQGVTAATSAMIALAGAASTEPSPPTATARPAIASAPFPAAAGTAGMSGLADANIRRTVTKAAKDPLAAERVPPPSTKTSAPLASPKASKSKPQPRSARDRVGF